MSTPHDPNDPQNQQSGDQPWGQESANRPDSQQPGAPYANQQSWGDQTQRPTDPYRNQGPGQPMGHSQGQYGQQQSGPYAGQQASQAGWAGGQPQQPGLMPTDGKSFFAALFDFNFKSFVTTKIIKVVYIVVTAAVGLGVLFFIISALVTRSPLAIIGALILGPLIGLIYLALARMTLELYYAVIRLSEDVHERLPHS